MVLLLGSRFLAVVERLRLRLVLTLVASVSIVMVALAPTVAKIIIKISSRNAPPARINKRRKRLKSGIFNFLFFLVGGLKDLAPGLAASARSSSGMVRVSIPSPAGLVAPAT